MRSAICVQLVSYLWCELCLYNQKGNDGDYAHSYCTKWVLNQLKVRNENLTFLFLN